MKQLSLNSAAYRYIEKSFAEWLDTLGYSWQKVYYMPLHIREMLHYFEQNEKSQISHIENKTIKEYYRYLKMRPNTQKAGALSSASLNSHLSAIYKFMDYLRQSGKLILPFLKIPREETDAEEITALTQEEIQQLYKACESQSPFQEKYNLRDKAMLAVLYGCGLRRNEAYHLNVNDIHFDRSLVHVRKGKGNKERFVPIGKTNLTYLQDYIYESRPEFLSSSPKDKRAKGESCERSSQGGASEALFISKHHKRMQGQSMLHRLKILIVRTENETLIEKQTGLHTLRHSIATHLLENGMSLENIAKFLGHSSLESTQIYTHLINEITP